MTQIHVYNCQGDAIVIEPRQNAFVDLFLAKLQQCIDQGYPIKSTRMVIPMPIRRWDAKVIRQLVHNIKDIVAELNDMGLNFPVKIDRWKFKADQHTRQILNRLHRCFTTGNHTLSVWQYDASGLPTNSFELRHKHVPRFRRLVHGINDNVHRLECYLESDRQWHFDPQWEYHVAFDNDHTPRFVDIPADSDQYRDDGGPWDVWIPLSQIQGKDFFRAYLDHDDPHAWDVCSCVQYSGDFAFTDMSYYRHPRLQQWLLDNDLARDPRTLAMPVGMVVMNKHLVSSLRDGAITGVEVR